MRVAPVALFSYGNYDKLLDTVRKVTRITHAHKVGIDGAILQVAIFVIFSLNMQSNFFF